MLLCGSPDRISSLARPHLCPSFRPSVYPVWVSNSKTRRRKITKIGVNVPRGRSNRCAIFYLERPKVKKIRRQQPPDHDAYLTYMFTVQLHVRSASWGASGGSSAHCKLTTVIRPRLLSARDVREWFSVFPIPPIPARSFPFPFPKVPHLKKLFPFPYCSR